MTDRFEEYYRTALNEKIRYRGKYYTHTEYYEILEKNKSKFIRKKKDLSVLSLEDVSLSNIFEVNLILFYELRQHVRKTHTYEFNYYKPFESRKITIKRQLKRDIIEVIRNRAMIPDRLSIEQLQTLIDNGVVLVWGKEKVLEVIQYYRNNYIILTTINNNNVIETKKVSKLPLKIDSIPLK